MSKICGCVILYGNRNLESIIKIKGLEMEAIAWINQVARFDSVNVHAVGNMGQEKVRVVGFEGGGREI